MVQERGKLWRLENFGSVPVAGLTAHLPLCHSEKLGPWARCGGGGHSLFLQLHFSLVLASYAFKAHTLFFSYYSSFSPFLNFVSSMSISVMKSCMHPSSNL